jgi:hypothetical protein
MYELFHFFMWDAVYFRFCQAELSIGYNDVKEA